MVTYAAVGHQLCDGTSVLMCTWARILCIGLFPKVFSAVRWFASDTVVLVQERDPVVFVRPLFGLWLLVTPCLACIKCWVFNSCRLFPVMLRQQVRMSSILLLKIELLSMVRSSCNRLHISFAELNTAALIFMSSTLSLFISFGVFIELLWPVFHHLQEVLFVHCCEKLKHPETNLYQPHQSRLCWELHSVSLSLVTYLKPLNPYLVSVTRMLWFFVDLRSSSLSGAGII